MAGDGGRVPDVSEQRADHDEGLEAARLKLPAAWRHDGTVDEGEALTRVMISAYLSHADPASVLAALLAESPEATVAAIEALLTSDDAEKPKRMRVDDLVTYKQWTGRVYEVLSDGSVLIDWSGHCQGFRHPFHHGPYRPDELMEASHKGAGESARLAAHEAFSTALSDRLVVGETLDRVADAAVAAYLVAACRSLLSKAPKGDGDA
jgi:hypothetical protein